MRKVKLISWNLSKAEAEFGIERATLRRKLAEAGQKEDEAGCYTTRQICIAMYGDAKGERTKLAVEMVKAAQLKNAKTEGKLIDVEAACFVAQRAAFAVRQRILASSLPDDEKKTLLADLTALGETDFAQAEQQDDTDAAEDAVDDLPSENSA
jgi:phage terminase Nu1 subunit (DNA packaging protein)